MKGNRRERFARVLISVLVALMFLSPAAMAGEFKVVRVTDGDTIKAKGHDIEIQVRLVGADAPEISHKKRDPGQPYGQQATKYLAGLVLNKVVDLRGYGLDQYNRILGVVFLDGKNINLEMVKAGLAEVYQGKPPHGFDQSAYLQAEREAKGVKRGMWVQGDKYLSPKDWRKLQKGK